jgi:hypothetical protein
MAAQYRQKGEPHCTVPTERRTTLHSPDRKENHTAQYRQKGEPHCTVPTEKRARLLIRNLDFALNRFSICLITRTSQFSCQHFLLHSWKFPESDLGSWASSLALSFLLAFPSSSRKVTNTNTTTTAIVDTTTANITTTYTTTTTTTTTTTYCHQQQ